MEKAEKENGSSSFRAHCFPSLKGVAEEPDSSDACFRPLFQGPAGNKNSPDRQPCDRSSADNGSDPLTVALKESFDRGMAAGNKDACGVALKELEPSLERFLGRLNEFSEKHGQICEEHPAPIVQLAIAIAEKLVGGDFSHSADAIDRVRESLDDLLRRYYQLNLQLNSSDIDQLADLMNCRGKEIGASTAVRVSDNDAIGPGKPQRGSVDASLEEFHENPIFHFEGQSDSS